MSSMHFYTTSKDEQLGYVSEGITAGVFEQQVAGSIPFFRWRHPVSNLHFYTIDEKGEAAPQLGYVFEKIECYVLPASIPGAIPLYRWYNAQFGDHLYTLDPQGELGPSSGYVSEGIVCYVFPQGFAGTTPLYRWVAGDQTYCIRLTKKNMVVFEKNYHVATYAQAKELAAQVLKEFDELHPGEADAAAEPKLGGC